MKINRVPCIATVSNLSSHVTLTSECYTVFDIALYLLTKKSWSLFRQEDHLISKFERQQNSAGRESRNNFYNLLFH